MNCLPLSDQEESLNECFRAFDLSSQPLSPSKLEEDQRRPARLAQEARVEWARFGDVQAAKKLHQCRSLSTKTDDGNDDTDPQLSGEISKICKTRLDRVP